VIWAARIAGVALIVGFAVIASWSLAPLPKVEAIAPIAATPPPQSPLPRSNPESGPSLLDRSPFARDHSAFTRNAGPPKTPIEVRLAGIFKVGAKRRAQVIIDGQSLTVVEGDQTAAGTVMAVEGAAVLFAGDPPRRIEMFKQ
jgi:hypothetical protein